MPTPTATITVADTSLIIGETSVVTFTFSEAVTGFDNTDITVGNGTLTAVNSVDGGITWTATLTPSAATEVATNAIVVDMTGVAASDTSVGVGTQNSNNYAIDTIAPTAPTLVLDAASDTGASSSDGITNDTTPLLTGIAEAGATVEIFDGVTSLGTTVADGTTGAFSFTSAALAEGAASFTAVATDTAGNAGAASAALAVTIDTTVPTLASSTPADNATGVAAGANLTLTFSEAIQAGTGNIVIDNGAGDIRTIAVTDATQVTLSGATATINPTADLQAGGGYNVTYAAGVVQDAAGNSIAPVADPTALNFTVAAAATPGGGGGTPTPTPTPPGAVLGDDQPNIINSGISNDQVFAGAGNDVVNGNQGSDLINGNQGDDYVRGGQGDDLVFGGKDNDEVFGDLGDDQVFGDLGDDFVQGNIGNDLVNGGQGNDLVFGGQGNDLVFGGQGDDQIFGDLGNDLLSGDFGNDTMTGGEGADTFLFRLGQGNDVVTDFDFATGDRLDLQGQTYTSAETAGSVTLTLSGGGTIVLQGVPESDFSASYLV
ncbi:hypothetical protein LCGC14_0352610 [marine sediment metagenome]|uniref:SbsA Ig-like domain-containing protein n=1 Tax=marine sediment metagenome TaxID=412755 RepID=A0A0F9TA93_9ZZZZ